MENKRVELCVHTNNTAINGINSIGDFIHEALKDWMPAIAITDIMSLSSLEDGYEIVRKNGGIKLLYGIDVLSKRNNKYIQMIILARNEKGLKDIEDMLARSLKSENDKTYISFDEISSHKDNLVLGISMLDELIYALKNNDCDTNIDSIISPVDFVMVHPIKYLDCLNDLKFKDRAEVIRTYHRIIDICDDAGKKVVASDNAYFVYKEDEECRKMIRNYYGYSYHNQPNMRFRTTNEMMNEFDFLSETTAERIVIHNTVEIANLCGEMFKPSVDKTQGKHIGHRNAYDIIHTYCQKEDIKYSDELECQIAEKIANVKSSKIYLFPKELEKAKS